MTSLRPGWDTWWESVSENKIKTLWRDRHSKIYLGLETVPKKEGLHSPVPTRGKLGSCTVMQRKGETKRLTDEITVHYISYVPSPVSSPVCSLPLVLLWYTNSSFSPRSRAWRVQTARSDPSTLLGYPLRWMPNFSPDAGSSPSDKLR